MPFHNPMDTSTFAWLKAQYYDCLSNPLLGPRPSGRDDEYASRVMWGTHEHRVQLDAIIENFLKGWDISRINKVDLALMRLAIYEMLREPDVPYGVAVNEAVELAKAYGTDESPAFINGVLGNAAREMSQYSERSENIPEGFAIKKHPREPLKFPTNTAQGAGRG